MATLRYAIPGVGGSLGMCAVCGDTFVAELLLGQSVGGLTIAGLDHSVPVHDKCADTVTSLQGPWKDVRDKFPEGPLKKCFDEQLAEQEVSRQDQVTQTD